VFLPGLFLNQNQQLAGKADRYLPDSLPAVFQIFQSQTPPQIKKRGSGHHTLTAAAGC
jgi:hypothetical protein